MARMSSRPRSGDNPAFAPRVVPLGDGAVMAELADTLDLDANAAAHRIAADVRRNAPEWVVDVMPALVTVTVHFAAETATDAAAHREDGNEHVRRQSLQTCQLRPGRPDPVAEHTARADRAARGA